MAVASVSAIIIFCVCFGQISDIITEINEMKIGVFINLLVFFLIGVVSGFVAGMFTGKKKSEVISKTVAMAIFASSLQVGEVNLLINIFFSLSAGLGTYLTCSFVAKS